MKYQQSAAIVALFLGTSNANRRAPHSVSLFATGMNGDEDLAEDITMKGDKFHYIQKNNSTAPVKVSKVAAKTEGKPEAAASKCNPGETANAVDGNCYFEGENVQTYADPPEKVLTVDPKIAKGLSSFYGQTASLVQVSDEEGPKSHNTEKLHVLEPIPAQVASNSFDAFPNQRTAFYAQIEDAPAAKAYEAHFQSTDEKYVRKYDTKGFGDKGGAEKVSVPDARITHTHTTFYDKKNGLWREDQAALLGWEAEVASYNGDAAEKVSVTEPANYAWHSNTNSLDGMPIMRSTYYGQVSSENQEDPEGVHVLEPEAYQNKANTNKPNPRTTFYPQAATNSFAQGAGGTETEKTHVLEPPAERQFAEENWGIHKGGRGARTSFY